MYKSYMYTCRSSLVRETEIVSENQAPNSKQGVVALDPGVRCFQTLYAPNGGYVMEWGTPKICINISSIIIAMYVFQENKTTRCTLSV